jgi:serine/threonine-protein kinase PknK
MLSQAVDHALTARDVHAAVHIIEENAMEMLERSKTATLLALVAKLPRVFVTTNPHLQLYVAWANIALQRPQPALAALDLVDAMLDSRSLDEADTSAMRAKVALVRTTVGFFADRFDDLPEVIEEQLHDPVDSFFATAAAVVASTAALYRFDFAEVHRWLHWAAPYHPQRKGPFGVVCGYCLAGLAAYEQLDIATAEADLRTALALGQTVGIHSHGARLASALLGAIRYDLGDVTGAEMLIDEGAELGQESAVVEFKMATYGIGSRVKVLRGELDAAEAWLAEGAKIAEDLGLPRLAARIDNERVRIGLFLDPVTRAELLHIPPFPHQQNGLHALPTNFGRTPQSGCC